VSNPSLRSAVLVLVFGACLTTAHQVEAQAEEIIAVAFTFPDGSAKSTSVTRDEVERLTGQRPAYMLLPWVLAALKKLEFAHTTETDAKGVVLTAIAGVSNGPQGQWVYSANGYPSPYRLDTQTIEGISAIAFSYRERAP
jgi:hypothetical protein